MATPIAANSPLSAHASTWPTRARRHKSRTHRFRPLDKRSAGAALDPRRRKSQALAATLVKLLNPHRFPTSTDFQPPREDKNGGRLRHAGRSRRPSQSCESLLARGRPVARPPPMTWNERVTEIAEIVGCDCSGNQTNLSALAAKMLLQYIETALEDVRRHSLRLGLGLLRCAVEPGGPLGKATTALGDRGQL